MSLFNPVLNRTKEEKVTRSIDAELRNAAIAMKRSYDNIRKLVYENHDFLTEYGVVDSNAIYTAFAINTTTGMTPEELGQMARVVKAAVNLFAPGEIEDDVPEANISFS